MAQKACPLCKRDAEAQSLQHTIATRVRCKACGQYDIRDVVIQDGVTNRLREIGRPQESHVLSALTRQASDRGWPITITWDSIPVLLESAPRLTVLDQMDRALICLANLQKRPDQFLGGAELATNYTLAFARDENEFYYLLSNLAERGLLQRDAGNPNVYRLSPEGWSKVEQLRKFQPDSDQAFVAMWFTDELKPAWEEGFKPALESTGYTPIRIDLVQHNDKIDDLIIAEIRRSGLLVADFTGNRGGVYYEAGFAMGLGVPIIWTCKDSDIEQVHFDTRQYNHIVWTSPEDLKEKLKNRIAATIPGRQVRG